MSNTMRWRYGDTNPVVAAVDSATEIEIGDLLYLDEDDAKPASALADQGSEAANQEAFAAAFLGVAMQRSRAGDTAPIRVATTGVFQFDCPAGTFEIGRMVGPRENVSADGLRDQQLTTVANSGQAVGRLARREPDSVTSVLVAIASTVMTGGVSGGSSSGS